MARARKAARPKSAVKSARKADAALEKSIAENRAPQATKIVELPKHLKERPSFNRYGERVDEGLDEARRPTIKIHRPHQETNPEREADDAKLGSGAALSA
jgi:hypothetical protein